VRVVGANVRNRRLLHYTIEDLIPLADKDLGNSRIGITVQKCFEDLLAAGEAVALTVTHTDVLALSPIRR
jgi:hypothetical protein